DDAYQGDDRRRQLERLRLGQLRQPLARAERRDERAGQRSRPGRVAARGLHAGSAAREEARRRRLAPPLGPRENARTLLELLRRNLLGGWRLEVGGWRLASLPPAFRKPASNLQPPTSK